MRLSIVVNDNSHVVDIDPAALLVHVLREDLGLTATHVGCDTSHCGACTVIMDGKGIKSCTLLAAQAEGSEIVTLEGLTVNGELSDVQQAFADNFALQCGFCTSGFVMATTAYLVENPRPAVSDIRAALAGNLCRCTGYQNIVSAALDAASRMQT